jgi:hypothetical protein
MLAIQSSGGRVTLMGPKIKGTERIAVEADRALVLRSGTAPVQIDPTHSVVRWTPQWASVVVRNLWRRLVLGPLLKPLGPGVRAWMPLRRSRDAIRAVDDADVIAAMDAGAIYSAWRCGRRNRAAAVINGIGPTLEHLNLAD